MYQNSEIFGKTIQKKVKKDGIKPSDMEKRMQRIKIGTRIHLNYIGFSKSKNDRVSVYFRNPLCEESAAANAVLMPILLSGSKKYPDLTAISEKLQELYGASLHDTNVKYGQEQIIGLSISFLSSRFTLEGEDNLSDCIAYIHFNNAFVVN